MNKKLSIPSPDPRLHKKYYQQATLIRRFVVFALRVFLFFLTERKVTGVENIPTEGGGIIAANHLTNFDVFPLQFTVPRTMVFMGKAEFYQHPLSDWFFRQLVSFPVYRGSKDTWAIEKSVEVLNNGHLLAMFPEGTRSKGRGLKPGKTGAARLALECNCPIIPVGIDGTQRITKDFPKRTPVRINIGEALYPEPNETALGLTERLMYSLADLLPTHLRGVYTERAENF